MHNHDEGRVGNIDKDDVLDISDLAAWSSSLTRNLDEYFTRVKILLMALLR